jgi:hypothetical protein
VLKLLKLFCEVKGHTWNSVDKVSRNAVNQDDLKGSHLKELHMSREEVSQQFVMFFAFQNLFSKTCSLENEFNF